MITAITPTGDRPLAMSLCERWMMNQTVRPDQWLVIDDGQVPFVPTVPMEYVRREPQPNDPQHMLALKLQVAIPLIKGDKILIIEDDEYYAPNYVEEMSKRLDKNDLVGIKQNRYYHIPSGGYHTMRNVGHASLAETAFTRSFLPIVRKVIDDSIRMDYLDIRIWQKGKSRASQRYRFGKRTFVTSRMGRQVEAANVGDIHPLLFSDSDHPLYVGIKGMPGRAGIGIGHNPSIYATRDTADRRVLKSWMPQDYQIYLDAIGNA